MKNILIYGAGGHCVSLINLIELRVKSENFHISIDGFLEKKLWEQLLQPLHLKIVV